MVREWLLAGLLYSAIFCPSVAGAQVELWNRISGDGSWRVQVADGGSSRDGEIDPIGTSQEENDVIYDYYHYVDVGADGNAVLLGDTTVTNQVDQNGAQLAISSGQFQGKNGIVRWTAKSVLPAGSNVYITKLQFASDKPFGKIRFIQYLDEDVQSVADDLLVVSGTPGQRDFQLFTVDGSYATGIAHGWYPDETSNAQYVGWRADRYSDLRTDITGNKGATFLPGGSIDSGDLKSKPDPRFPGKPVYGPKDVTTAIAFDLAPTAKSAAVTVFLGGSPGGQLIDANDFSTDTEDEPLVTPVHTKYNTYLGQWNFLELINAGTKATSVKVSVYNLLGAVMGELTVAVGAKKEFDVDINAIIRQACSSGNAPCSGLVDLDNSGTVDTYGLVRLDFDDTDPEKLLLGRMSHYRAEPGDGSYSFAFARELRNPSRGTSYALGNTFDPQGQGYLVPNWVEVINLSESALEFRYNLYRQDGSKVASKLFTVPPLGEKDLQGGHEILNAERKVAEGVYLVEVVPARENADYLMYVSRYSSNAVPGSNTASFNYAFASDGHGGSTRPMYVPLSAEKSDELCASTTNWLEIVNTASSPVKGSVIFRDQSGNEIAEDTRIYHPHSQFHFAGSAILAAKNAVLGSAEIKSETVGALLAQSLVYLHDCDRNNLSGAWAIPGLRTSGATLAGTVNTFLGMTDTVYTMSTVNIDRDSDFLVSSFGGYQSAGSNSYQPYSLNRIDIDKLGTQGFPMDDYGVVKFQSTGVEQLAGFVLRTRTATIGGRKRIDFVMPTKLR